MIRIESLSLRTVTVGIFLMIGLVAVVLSFLAGSYFRQAALDAQMNSLSRVIEVAAEEMLREVRAYTFDLGMRLGQSPELVDAIGNLSQTGNLPVLAELLDDPFINGFVGFSNINLEKIRLYDQKLELIAESGRGNTALPAGLPPVLQRAIGNRSGVDRLKAVDALWHSPIGPLHSTVVPVGGLRLMGYLEVVINPAFNLPDIARITKTPISIFAMDGRPLVESQAATDSGHLPVEYIMPVSTGEPAFRIVGYEDVRALNREMKQTQLITTSGFLVLTISTLGFSLWLFQRFLFLPLRQMIAEMRKMAAGELNLTMSDRGLREFAQLADTFEVMAGQVRSRTRDLERLLDLDDSAIFCFGENGEAVYFNNSAASLFGYTGDDISDLELRDLFAEDIEALLRQAGATPGSHQQLQVPLTGNGKDGTRFQGDAIIRSLQGLGGQGYAIVFNPVQPDAPSLPDEVVDSFRKNAQRMDAVEQSLNSLLELARNNPAVVAAGGKAGAADTAATVDKAEIRQQAVNVMLAALACWEHDLGRSKLALAEESAIWPVYIDKSTPTTRTLDKYLNLDSCPKNPRTQRVIDTAEFVLKQLGRRSTADRGRLQQALHDFRLLVSGIKPAND